ncbi:DUF4116 domain-containing protein [Roseibium sp. RKSG952]|nr:DUF4116 domain-containing protein [Roseibium sp. RKSG952]
MCREAVRQSGWALSHVPKVLRTPELCREAVRQDGWALIFVPEALRTREIASRRLGKTAWRYAICRLTSALRSSAKR